MTPAPPPPGPGGIVRTACSIGLTPARPHGRRLAWVVLATLGVVLAACGGGSGRSASGRSAAKPLRIGIVPNVAPDAQRAKYTPLGTYLQGRLHRPVTLFVATSYAGTVQALIAGQLDVAYLGGLTYVQARQRVPVVPLVTEVDRDTGTPQYLSQIITTTSSGITSLKELDGKVLALGDPSSTSGSLYPRRMLVDAGFTCSTTKLDSCPPLSSVLFTGGHDAAIAAVTSGRAAAAGVEARILHRLQRDGTVTVPVTVLDERRVMGYPWVARTAVPEATRRAVTAAFLGIGDPMLLDLLRARSYVPVQPSDYAEVDRFARQLGLLASS